jgi:hypothetical protein
MSEIMYNTDDYKSFLVNTHKSKIVIQDKQIELIKNISDVESVVPVGSYGMELIITYSYQDDVSTIIDRVSDIIQHH